MNRRRQVRSESTKKKPAQIELAQIRPLQSEIRSARLAQWQASQKAVNLVFYEENRVGSRVGNRVRFDDQWPAQGELAGKE